MKHRRLRVAWSVGWGIAAVLLIALWMRSYWRRESVQWSTASLRIIALESLSGRFEFIITNPRGNVPFSYSGGEPMGSSRQKWVFVKASGNTVVAFPFWFPTVILGALAALPWMRWPTARFSLRTLLIATTLVAVVLGLIAWAAH